MSVKAVQQSILVVDDTEANLLVIEDLLSDLVDVELILANSGERALELLMSQTQPPAIALLDIQMPGLDGYQLAELYQFQN